MTTLADVIKVSFGGDRSAAGRYAAQQRWLHHVKASVLTDATAAAKVMGQRQVAFVVKEGLGEAIKDPAAVGSALGETLRLAIGGLSGPEFDEVAQMMGDFYLNQPVFAPEGWQAALQGDAKAVRESALQVGRSRLAAVRDICRDEGYAHIDLKELDATHQWTSAAAKAVIAVQMGHDLKALGVTDTDLDAYYAATEYAGGREVQGADRYAMAAAKIISSWAASSNAGAIPLVIQRIAAEMGLGHGDTPPSHDEYAGEQNVTHREAAQRGQSQADALLQNPSVRKVVQAALMAQYVRTQQLFEAHGALGKTVQVFRGAASDDAVSEWVRAVADTPAGVAYTVALRDSDAAQRRNLRHFLFGRALDEHNMDENAPVPDTADASLLVNAATRLEQSAAKMGAMLQAQLRPLSSFSNSERVAERFASVRTLPQDADLSNMGAVLGIRSKGVVMVAEVPTERILSTPLTGFGCMEESEMVVTGPTVKTFVGPAQKAGQRMYAWISGDAVVGNQ